MKEKVREINKVSDLECNDSNEFVELKQEIINQIKQIKSYRELKIILAFVKNF